MKSIRSWRLIYFSFAFKICTCSTPMLLGILECFKKIHDLLIEMPNSFSSYIHIFYEIREIRNHSCKISGIDLLLHELLVFIWEENLILEVVSNTFYHPWLLKLLHKIEFPNIFCLIINYHLNRESNMMCLLGIVSSSKTQ